MELRNVTILAVEIVFVGHILVYVASILRSQIVQLIMVSALNVSWLW